MLVTELKNLQAKLSAMKIDGLSKEQVAEKYLEVQKKYKHIKRVLEKLNNLIVEVLHLYIKLSFCPFHIAKKILFCV